MRTDDRARMTRRSPPPTASAASRMCWASNDAALRPVALCRCHPGAQDQRAAEAHRIRQSRAGRALVILVGEDGSVENRVIQVPPGLPPSTFIQASNYLSTRFQGKTIDEVQRFVRDESSAVAAARTRRDFGAHRGGRHRPVVRGCRQRQDADRARQANLIENATAAADLERIRKLFEDIENKRELAQLLGAAETGEGVKIFIGSENRLFSLSGSSIVLAPYRNSEREDRGRHGHHRPTRMNYAGSSRWSTTRPRRVGGSSLDFGPGQPIWLPSRKSEATGSPSRWLTKPRPRRRMAQRHPRTIRLPTSPWTWKRRSRSSPTPRTWRSPS